MFRSCALPTLSSNSPLRNKFEIDLRKDKLRFSGCARKRRILLRGAKNPLLRFLWPSRFRSLSEEQKTQCSMAYRALRENAYGNRMPSTPPRAIRTLSIRGRCEGRPNRTPQRRPTKTIWRIRRGGFKYFFGPDQEGSEIVNETRKKKITVN